MLNPKTTNRLLSTLALSAACLGLAACGASEAATATPEIDPIFADITPADFEGVPDYLIGRAARHDIAAANLTLRKKYPNAVLIENYNIITMNFYACREIVPDKIVDFAKLSGTFSRKHENMLKRAEKAVAKSGEKKPWMEELKLRKRKNAHLAFDFASLLSAESAAMLEADRADPEAARPTELNSSDFPTVNECESLYDAVKKNRLKLKL